jgi:type II secretory ATPase GspE/PulE/Tfp pilus assembly ATPase PilB-like protein
MSDAWYFEIGDGRTYGPVPLEKLRKWAAVGNLMPTHRVRHADSQEWLIAADVPGLEGTLAVSSDVQVGPPPGEAPSSLRSPFGKLGRALTRRKKEAPAATESNAPVSTEARAVVPQQMGGDQTSAVRMCDEILEIASVRNASDIHLEPEDNIAVVQLRVDGELETLRKCSKQVYSSILSRFKVLSKMDIAEKRAPQDGKFRHIPECLGHPIDVRTACLPTTHGERMTLRLLGVATEQLTIHRLGLSPRDVEQLCHALAHKQGLILVTGATGSGKSTTLYAAIRYLLAHRQGKIITIEDPVEFDIVGVAQVEVDHSERVQFETALRTVLRSDPDVLMIGEIRDLASADIALKAALTGHLVLSSLHTNSALGAVTRLLNFGIPPYLVAATLRLCIGQQLVRRLCPHCRRATILGESEAELIGRPESVGATIHGPGTCSECHERGYRGRIGIYEAITLDHAFASLISQGCQESELAHLQKELQIPSLKDDAVAKLLAGQISLEGLISAGFT